MSSSITVQSNKGLLKPGVVDKKPKKLSKKAMADLVWDNIQEYEQKYHEPVPKREIISQMVEAGVDEKITKDLITKLLKEGSIYQPKNGFYRTIDD